VLPALSLSDVLHLDALAGSYNAVSFNSFIDGLLDNMNLYPGPKLRHRHGERKHSQVGGAPSND
jgi:hypothetical protein